MKLYNEDGYLNIEAILDTKLPFLFVTGGRGIGKTFGALEYILTHNKKFIFLRRTQSQVDLINKPEFSPFRPIAEYLGIGIISKPLSKYNVGFYKAVESDEGKLEAVGSCLGYSMALSTVSNLRGFDASDVDILIFDEFQPEKHERPIKNEAQAFFNAYETINRNRELQGRQPLQALCLSNSNDAGNSLYMELKLISKVETMKKKGQQYSLDYNRGIGIFLLDDSPISTKKQETALYKATQGNEFQQMALSNDFAEFKTNSIKPQPIKEYKALCTVGEITFYRHKSNSTQYYCTTLKTGTPDGEEYDSTETEIKRWYRKYYFLWEAYMKNKIYFEDATSELIFNKYLH